MAVEVDVELNSEGKIPVPQTTTALAISFMIYKAASHLTEVFEIQEGIVPAVTAIVSIFATALPKQFSYLAPADDTIAMVLMQVAKIYLS